MSSNFMDSLSRIGKGIKLPFTFSQRGNVRGTATDTSLDKINDAIKMILQTSLSERFMNNECGSLLDECLFDFIDEAGRDLIYLYSVEALQRWVPIISVTGATFLVDAENNAPALVIEYTVIGTPVSGTYTYPFQQGAMPTQDLITGENYANVVR